MRFFSITALVLITTFSSAAGRPSKETVEKRNDVSQKSVSSEVKEQNKSKFKIVLDSGGEIQVDAVRETADGVWYTSGSVTTLLDKSRVKRIEQPKSAEEIQAAAVRENLAAKWSINDSAKVEKFFITKFARPLPTTAFGQSDLHNRWNLDHRNGLDVGLHPDSAEGRALINFLQAEDIPFLVFRNAIPGVATGPHIHIGNGSHRLSAR